MTQTSNRDLIEAAYSNIASGTAPNAKSIEAVRATIDGLDHGTLRVAEKVAAENGSGTWVVNEWIKKAILLYFRTQDMNVVRAGDLEFFDKVPLKKWTSEMGVRVVPHALARKGSFIEKGAILMPSYVNIGARVGSGTLVDTWATVGSCAQVGRNVHISGGVGLGGVLEPVQAAPVVIEDDVFLGSRSIVVEGVVVEEAAVIGAGVVLTASTKIIDVTGGTERILRGRVPARSVVIPGSTKKQFPAGEYGVPCALIIGHRTASTDKKTSLNHALRDYGVDA
jgi:2,3,4,5-tetrahydropyridine-2,6-dicarboxylate N-succinyltransferase